LGGNYLSGGIPDSIGCLYELTALGLADNQLESIPATIANLHKLRNLSLHNNKLKVKNKKIIKNN
jgi:Leucine-rich repeat (LRR) protein